VGSVHLGMMSTSLEPIAITGMSCRFPGGSDIDAYWRLLESGGDAITEVPADRFDLQSYYDPDPDAPGKIYVRKGGFIANAFDFDPGFFGISPREALSMDPQQRLLLELAWEALEDAGEATEALAGSSAGVFVGHSTNDYVRRSFGREIDAYSGTGSATSIASGRISYVLGLTGPNLSADTACSSSLVALHLACQSLRGRECHLALAAGVNLILAPEPTIYFCKMRALAPDGRCKTFDALANGYARGEGCGALVLKRLSDALAAGDRIHAVIRGTATNHDGRSTGLTVPNRFAQEALLRAALDAAGVSPEEIDYIETHGTGTPLGDPIEIQAIATVHARRQRPLVIGSVKTNIGHLEAAAGIAGVIKTVLSMQRERIPPHLNFYQPNPHIPWQSAPLVVPTELLPWPAHPAKPRLAGISSFGFSGTNAHVIIEQAPPPPLRRPQPDRPLHLLCLSAKDEGALQDAALAATKRLAAPASDQPFADICYSSNSGRSHFAARLSVVAADAVEARTALQQHLNGAPDSAVHRSQAAVSGGPKIAFLFTGQGSQYVQMGVELYETIPLFREVINQCNRIIGNALTPSLLDTLYPSNGGVSPIDETAFAQPALFALEYALASVWRSWGVEPVFCLGHSIGELVAACVAGVFSLDDGLRLAEVRGRLMQSLPRDGMMASVRADADTVREILNGVGAEISIAAINGPTSTVISGRSADLELGLEAIAKSGKQYQSLAVSHAFHSALMDPVLDRLEEVARGVRYSPPTLGLVSTLTGRVATDAEFQDPGYWRRQARESVRFADAVRVLDERGYNLYLEIGPHPVLTGLARSCVADGNQVWSASLRRGTGSWRQMLQAVGEVYASGVAVDWRSFDKGYQRCRVKWPTYPFQRSRYVIEGADPVGVSVAPSPTPRATVQRGAADLVYELQWDKKPCATAADPPSGRWLLFADCDGLAARVSRDLEARGSRCVLVAPGTEMTSSADGHWTIRPGVKDDYEKLLAAVEAVEPCVGIVHAWSCDVREPCWIDRERNAGVSHGTGSVLYLVQVIAARHPHNPPPLWLVTRGVHRILDQDTVDGLTQAPVWGLARSIAIEHPPLKCTRVDLESTVDSADWISPATQTVLSVLGARDNEDQVCFRSGQRYVARLRRTMVANASLAIRDSGTYLITGGLGGLGLVIAGWLAGRGARHLVLVGRNEPAASAQETIAQLRGRGVTVHVLQADVADRSQVRAVFRQIAETMPALKGVVHAAGVLDDGAVLRQEWSHFEQVMRPKLEGTWNLHQESLDLSLEFFVLFSSIGSVMGAPRQANYCAANTFLDAMAHYRRARGLAALAVNWGPWSDVGMASRQHAAVLRTWETLGIELLPHTESLEALEKLLAGAAAQRAVIKADWSKLIALFPQGLEPPVLRELVKGERGSRPASQAWSVVLQRLPSASAADASRTVQRFVAGLVAEVLGRSDADAIDPDKGFFDLGMDSMMTVDLMARLRANLGDAHLLPASFAFDHPTVAHVARYLMSAVSPTTAPSVTTKRGRRTAAGAIAVVGYACRFPGARDESEFWTLHSLGRDAIKEVPADRWDLRHFYDPDPKAPGKMYVREGGFLDAVDQFDAQFFGISPREAVKMDPQHRLLLETCWRALENAHHRPDSLRGSETGVFIGISGNDYVRVLGQSVDAAEVDAYLATGNAPSIAAGRLSHVFGFVGPCLAVDTACSSSLVAVHLACESLRQGKAKLALAGGVNVILAPEITISLCKIGALSPDGRCKTFDATANGYVRSEGCGVVVLKRLEDALSDRDRILATILASSINHDGRSSGLTVPKGTAQVALYSDALKDCAIGPHEVQYVEAHGTGTPLGDPIEMGSIASFYAKGRSVDRPLLVGSVKTNVGHLEAAAGIAGLIRVIQCLEHGVVTPSLHFHQPSHHINWHAAPVKVPTSPEPWPGDSSRIAAVSSFGFSGTNAHCVIEGPVAEEAEAESRPSRSTNLLCLSAKSDETLLEYAVSVESRLAQCDGDHDQFADVCFSLNAGRSQFPRRLAVVASTAQEARNELAGLVKGLSSRRSACSQSATAAPRVALLFSGLGSHYVGMGQSLFETQPLFRQIIEEADGALAQVLGGSLTSVLYPGDRHRSAVFQVRWAEPAVFVLEYALYRLWESWGLRPAAVLGHSVGECAAACVAGVLSFADALTFVGERARVAQELPRGGMLAIAADESSVRAALGSYDGRIEVAAINSPHNTVVAGPPALLKDLLGEMKAKGIDVHRLRVSQAYHSTALSHCEKEFLRAAQQMTYSESHVPLVSTVTGEFATTGLMSEPGYWAQQLVKPVKFNDAMRTLLSADFDVFLEIGPHPALTILGQEIDAARVDRPRWLYSLRRGGSDWDVLLTTMMQLYVTGVDFDWKAFDGARRRKWVDVPNYPLQRERYWPQPADPAPTAGAGPLSPSTPADDPLLGRRLRAPGLDDTVFENRFSVNRPALLADHKVQSRIVVPGACHVSMVVAAAYRLGLGPRVELRDVTFPEGLILDETETRLVELILTSEGNGSRDFRVVSARDEDQAWLVHSTGTLVGGDVRRAGGNARRDGKARPSGKVSIQSLRDRCPDHVSDTQTLYRLLAQHGIELGPQFQWIAEAWRRPGEALARLRTVSPADHTPAYVVHPGWIDACFQLLTATLTRIGADLPTYLPIGIGRFILNDRLEGPLWIHVTLRPQQESEPAILESDIRILREDGTVVGRIDRFRVRRAPRESMTRFAHRNVTDTLYHLEWVKSETTEGQARLDGGWLLLDDADGMGVELARLIEGAGGTCIRIGRMAAAAGAPGVDATSIESFRALLQKAESELPELTGVLHLWSSSTSREPAPDWSSVLERQSAGARSALNLVKALGELGLRRYPRLWLVTRGVETIAERRQSSDITHAPLSGLARVIALEHPQLRCTRIDLDPSESPGRGAAMLLSELQCGDREDQIAYSQQHRFVARLTRHRLPSKEADEDILLPSGAPYRLTRSTQGSLTELSAEPAAVQAPGPGEVQIRVMAAGVNFRDVLNALNLNPGGPPILGWEMAGVVTAVGNRISHVHPGDGVLGLAPGSFSNLVIADGRVVAPKPPNLSFGEAASAPVVFLTARYALKALAQLAAGEKILIHAAGGGVGLAAVQLAQQLGAQVFATAGSSEKRQRLRDLGIRDVFDSRSLHFCDEIKAATGGAGVDVVLNCLTGDYIPKSLEVLARGGRFVEIGRIGIWSQEQIASSRPDVRYFIFALDKLMLEEPGDVGAVLEEIVEHLGSGRLVSLPLTSFPMRKAGAALRYMAQAKHFGKIVLEIEASPEKRQPSTTLRGDATYLITGGLGGLGLSLAGWMLREGARHLVLLSREGQPERVANALGTLNSPDADVQVLSADVANADQLRSVIRHIEATMPPLRGVFHLAGVLDDGLLMNQNWDRFLKVMRPKVLGTVNLHESTRASDLDFFVMFSSSAAVLGFPGQSNYAAANSFLDAFADYRVAAGLPAQSINWGAWDDIGMTAGLGRKWRALGIGTIKVDQGMDTLGMLLRARPTHVAVLPVDWSQVAQTFPRGERPPLLSSLAHEFSTSMQPSAEWVELSQIVSAAPAGERKALVVQRLLEMGRLVLGMRTAQSLDSRTPLNELGFDSLMAVELANSLSRWAGRPFPATLLFDYPTFDRLADHILDEVVKFASVGADKSSSALEGPSRTTVGRPQRSQVHT
jgi:acyl transferase domain-containing protein/acyl carrier protein